jgi:hypothetical protein
VPIGAGTTFGPTGSQLAIDALGYLHANCGHCHNPDGQAGQINNQTLRLDAVSKAVELEPGWTTTVGVLVQGFGAGGTVRIDPMKPDNSAVLLRMSRRGSGQMPPIATKVVDTTGVTAVTSWDNALP